MLIQCDLVILWKMNDLFFNVECNLDLVTNFDLVTILQMTIFLVHKNITFSWAKKPKKNIHRTLKFTIYSDKAKKFCDISP